MVTNFISRFIVFAFIGAVLLEFIIAPVLIDRGGNLLGNPGWIKVNKRIEQSKRVINHDVLVVGDSVANQIFTFTKQDNYLTSNASVYPAGNLILIANALTANPQIKRVVYLVVPNLIGHPFERERTYPYYIKPFFKRENLNYFEPMVLDKMARHPTSFLTFFDAFRVLPLDDIDFSVEQKKTKGSQIKLSEFSLLYLKKIHALCANHNVKFELRSPPIPLRRKKRTGNWRAMRDQVMAEEDLAKVFEGYFESIKYLEIQNFEDGLHLKEKILSEKRSYWQNLYLHEHVTENNES